MLTTERRAHQRIRYSEEVHTHYGVRFTQKTWTKDISDGGLLLLGHAPGPPGEMLQIEMSVDGQPGVTLSRWAQIVRVEPKRATPCWAVAFVRPMNDDTWQRHQPTKRLLLAGPDRLEEDEVQEWDLIAHTQLEAIYLLRAVGDQIDEVVIDPFFQVEEPQSLRQFLCQEFEGVDVQVASIESSANTEYRACLSCHRFTWSPASTGPFCADCLDWTAQEHMDVYYDDIGGSG